MTCYMSPEVPGNSQIIFNNHTKLVFFSVRVNEETYALILYAKQLSHI